jgi:hypothetical protein
MKKLIVLAAIVFSQLCANAQMLTTPPAPAPSDLESGKEYLRKSHNGKIAGFILLGGGIILAAAGVHEMTNDLFSKSDKGSIAGVTGVAMILASVPVFIISAKNKGKSKILLRGEKAPLTYKDINTSRMDICMLVNL